MLSKYKKYIDRSFAPVYFHFTSKTVIGPKYSLDKSIQEIFDRIDNWISGGSGWTIASIDTEYVNICTDSPLSGSPYIELPDNLRN